LVFNLIFGTQAFMMKYRFLLLLTAFAPALFGQQIMTVSVDQDNFIVCPDEIVEVSAARSSITNNSLLFDGSTQSFEIPNNAAFNIGTTDFSVEMWVWTQQTSGVQYLAVYRDASAVGWVIFVDANGRVAFGAKDNSGGATRYLYSGSFANPVSINDGQWHHVAVTWGRGPNEVIMYIDGTEVSRNTNGTQPGQQPFPGGDISHSSAITLGYGVSPSGGGPVYFDGEIDEFRIWNGARSVADIQNLMSTHLNPASFSSLAVNFDFNETNSSDGWKDCASGIVSPTGVSIPAVNTAGGPSMTFNFAYNWTNTSGNTQSGSNYQKSFKSDDTVIVEIGYCKYLCSDTVIIQIADCDTVRDPRDVAAVFMPTAFTPNGDTKNDYYTVKANAISYFELQIYNRDGNILFHSKDIQTSWDGTFEGKLCMEGVYTAQVLFRDIDGEEFIRYQQFNLMR